MIISEKECHDRKSRNPLLCYDTREIDPRKFGPYLLLKEQWVTSDGHIKWIFFGFINDYKT